MTSTATQAFEDTLYKTTATGAVPTGTLIISPEGSVMVFQGLKAAATNDPVIYDADGVYDITKGSISFALGDNVYFDGTDVQTSGVMLVGKCIKTAASGDATVRVRLYPYPIVRQYTSKAASTAVANTTTETAFDQNVTIPASALRAGDVIHIVHQGIATATNSTDTLKSKLYIGATNIADTGAIDVANNDIFVIDAYVQIRTVGASGTLVAWGTTNIGTSGTATTKAFYLASTAIDTTASQLITAKATWSVANAGDSCRQDVMIVQKIN
jgi:hypothetical protein